MVMRKKYASSGLLQFGTTFGTEWHRPSYDFAVMAATAPVPGPLWVPSTAPSL